jgi:hypothetical protein
MDKKQLKDGDKFTGYCTKYALTKGVFSAPFEVCQGKYARQLKGGIAWCTIGRDVFIDRAEASVNAKERAWRKVKSLEKSLAAMQKLALEPKWEAG